MGRHILLLADFRCDRCHDQRGRIPVAGIVLNYNHRSDSVTFDEGYKSYYYIADDDSIEVGDYVIVPAGKDNHEATVEVVKKEYFAADEVPLPMEKTKHIIRKCTEDDFDLPKDSNKAFCRKAHDFEDKSEGNRE